MAKPEFIIQGFTFKTHADAFRRLFDIADIQKVLVSVAFVNEGGVAKIEAQLKPYAARTTVFAGVRNDTTSYQGLVRLHGIVSELYIVDTHSRTTIFHPKLYLVCGTARARLMIGSANLTLAGLNNNIEAGMLLDFDLADTGDKALIDDIEKTLAAAVTDYPDHIVRVSAVADLDQMLFAGRLINELEVAPRRRLFGADASNDIDTGSSGVPPIRLKVKPLKKLIAGTSAKLVEPKDNAVLRAAPEPISPTNLESRAVFDATDISTVPHRLVRKKRRKRDGPKLRARKAIREAKRLGKRWYWTGEPCIYGHYAERLVSNGKCRECNKRDCKRYNRLYR